MKTCWTCALAIVAAGQVLAAPQIVGFSNGTLIGSNLTPNTTAAVEWSPTTTGPWTNTWAAQAAIAVGSNGMLSVPVAFHYRLQDNVGGVTTSSTSTSTTSSSTSAAATTSTSSTTSTAQPLSAHVAAFVGFNADGDDGFALVALTALPASTDFYFCDNEWNGLPIGSGGAFNDDGEAEVTWNTGAGVGAGIVVVFTNMSVLASRGASIGTLTGGTMALSSSDEAIFAFEGTSATNPTAFMAAIANNTNAATIGSLAGTGLDPSVSAVILPGAAGNGTDIGQYTGPRTGFSGAGYHPSIANVGANWILENTGANDSTNGISPDLPFDTTPFTP